jgi:hypothetical protein
MRREREMDKKFSEYLDRILAGEEIKADPAMDKELRAALDFARKISELGTKPSAQYQARLKARLLQKLEEQKAPPKEGRGSFWNIFRGHPVWQGAVAALLVILVLSIIWRAGFFQPSIPLQVPTTTSPAATATVPPATTAAPTTKALPAATTPAPAVVPSPSSPVSVEAKTDKATYQPGEAVKIELSMKNVSQNQLTVQDFPPILSLMRADTNQPVYTFAAGKDSLTLAPNAVARYTYTWKEVDFQGQPVTGSYYIELEDLEYNGLPVQLNLNQPARFAILPSTVY